MTKLLNASAEDVIKHWAGYIVTLDQREQLFQIIDKVIAGLFRSDILISFDLFPAQFRLGLPSVEFPIKDPELAGEVSKFLSDVKALLLDLPLVELVLAFNPSIAFLSVILDRIRLERKDFCLIKYEYNPDILGGAIIKMDGSLSDYSLRRLVDVF